MSPGLAICNAKRLCLSYTRLQLLLVRYTTFPTSWADRDGDPARGLRTTDQLFTPSAATNFPGAWCNCPDVQREPSFTAIGYRPRGGGPRDVCRAVHEPDHSIKSEGRGCWISALPCRARFGTVIDAGFHGRDRPRKRRRFRVPDVLQSCSARSLRRCQQRSGRCRRSTKTHRCSGNWLSQSRRLA